MRQILTILFPALVFLIGFQHSDFSVADDKVNIELVQKETSSEITLDQILEKHYEARGGERAWKQVNTLKFTGAMYTKKATFQTAAVFKRPDKCRLDFQAGRLYFMESYDGEVPWQMNPGSKAIPEVLKGKRAKEMIDTCDFDGPLIDHKKEGHRIKYLGQETLDDRSAYVLEVIYKTGNIDKYYLDTETYLPFMVKGNTTIQDKTVSTTVKIGEYIEIGDITIPFSYEFIVEGNPDTETLEIKTVELNEELEDSIFELPKRPQDLR